MLAENVIETEIRRENGRGGEGGVGFRRGLRLCVFLAVPFDDIGGVGGMGGSGERGSGRGGLGVERGHARSPFEQRGLQASQLRIWIGRKG